MWLRKMLMNAADSSDGGGAVPSNGQPQANAAGSTSSPAIDDSVVQKLASEIRNSIFAEMRRAGVLGGDEKQKAAKAPTSNEQATAPGLSMADVQRVGKFQRVLGAAGLSDEQASIVETLFDVERPDTATIGDWVTAKARALGVGRAGTSTNNPAASATAPAIPASNAGAPVSPGRFTEDTPIHQWSEADRAAFLKAKGMHEYARKFREDMRGQRIAVRRK